MGAPCRIAPSWLRRRTRSIAASSARASPHSDDVQDILAYLDEKGTCRVSGRLQAAAEEVPKAIDLARPMIDLGYTATEETEKEGLPRQSFTGGGLVYDVTRTPRRDASDLGAFIRVGAVKTPPDTTMTGTRAISAPSTSIGPSR